MPDNLRLMCIFAHPDDESLGTGGCLAKYAAEGVEIFLVTATRGERGWFGGPAEYPGLQELGAIREEELRCAAGTLGIRHLAFLDYVDGELDRVDYDEAATALAAHIRRARPQVVMTFPPDGIYGHPDHIAISQLTSGAVVIAADARSAQPSLRDLPAHCVSKLYYSVATRDILARYQPVFGDLVMDIDGVERRAQGWEEWLITTWIDTSAHWPVGWEAVKCHRSQLPGYEKLLSLSSQSLEALWSRTHFYRVFSLVNGSHRQETDLFEGLR